MEKDKSIILQKQIKDNAEDLRNEFLDMKNWEEKMAKADALLQAPADDQGQLLPPVRRKKSSSRTKLKAKENGSKAKKIKSFDYEAWDQFDADKACEALDKECDSEDSGTEILSKDELEKNHEEASKHKIMGNKYVQERQWAKAMACYNEAIKIFPYDAVFYANRALCHLKIENLYSAQSDCTAAIQRDEHYVKAYHRRATARIALKQYKEAIQDLKTILNLEPTNKEAKKMLQEAMKYSGQSKPLISSSSTATEEKMAEKKIIDVSPTPVKPAAPIKDENKIMEIVDVKKKVENEGTSRTTVEKRPEMSQKIELPSWLPILMPDDCSIVQPAVKAPHQLMKSPLKSVPIKLTDFSDLIPAKSTPTSTIPASKLEKIVELPKKVDLKPKIEVIGENVPPVPINAVQFLLTWRKFKCPDMRYKYLKQLAPEKIPTVFKESMETDVFSQIISTLKSQFLPRKDAVFPYLKYLSEIKRFKALTMFLENQEKEDLKALFDHCFIHEDLSDETVVEIRSRYEI